MSDVLLDEREDRVYEATVSDDNDDHMFELWVDYVNNGHRRLIIEYQESQVEGQGFVVQEPRDPVWAELIASDEVRDIILDNHVVSVRRKNSTLLA